MNHERGPQPYNVITELKRTLAERKAALAAPVTDPAQILANALLDAKIEELENAATALQLRANELRLKKIPQE